MKVRRFFACVVTLAVIMLPGCDKNAARQTQSTVSVFGTGTVMASPDMVQLSVALSRIAATTREAQEEVNRMVRETMEILKDAGIEDKNISTASLTFNSEYDYSGVSRTLIGQKAEQRLTFAVEDLQNSGDRISLIIDRLIGINGIELNQINFSIKNNAGYFARSRELAFQKAVEKAEQYAALSGLTLVRALSLSEEGTQQWTPLYSNRAVNQQMSVAAEAQSSGDSAILPSGEMEITTRLNAVFLLE